jgi:hypothetical protein
MASPAPAPRNAPPPTSAASNASDLPSPAPASHSCPTTPPNSRSSPLRSPTRGRRGAAPPVTGWWVGGIIRTLTVKRRRQATRPQHHHNPQTKPTSAASKASDILSLCPASPSARHLPLPPDHSTQPPPNPSGTPHAGVQGACGPPGNVHGRAGGIKHTFIDNAEGKPHPPQQHRHLPTKPSHRRERKRATFIPPCRHYPPMPPCPHAQPLTTQSLGTPHAGVQGVGGTWKRSRRGESNRLPSPTPKANRRHHSTPKTG